MKNGEVPKKFTDRTSHRVLQRFICQTVATRYKLALTVKDHLRDFSRVAPTVERDLRAGNIDEAREKFIALGEALKPLATMLDGVRFERKDEQKNMKNVVQWLRRLKSPFAAKFLQGDSLDAETWISLQLPEIEDTLKSLVRVQGRLDAYQTVEKTFQHGPFKVVNLVGYRPDEYAEILQVLDQAADKLRSKGFGSVLYGEVILKGAAGFNAAGAYIKEYDKVFLNAESRYRFSNVFTLVHEFGHRYWDKKLSSAQREEYEDKYVHGTNTIDLANRWDMWQALVKADFSPAKATKFLKDPGLAQTLKGWFKWVFDDTRMNQQGLLRSYQRGEKWVEVNFVRPRSKYVSMSDDNSLVTVSDYAQSNVSEDYADTFAHYVLGMPMPPEVMERFKLTM